MHFIRKLVNLRYFLGIWEAYLPVLRRGLWGCEPMAVAGDLVFMLGNLLRNVLVFVVKGEACAWTGATMTFLLRCTP